MAGGRSPKRGSGQFIEGKKEDAGSEVGVKVPGRGGAQVSKWTGPERKAVAKEKGNMQRPPPQKCSLDLRNPGGELGYSERFGSFAAQR